MDDGKTQPFLPHASPRPAMAALESPGLETLTTERQLQREYLQEMKSIITRPGTTYATSGPARLLDHMYIGNRENANNRKLLKRLGITHVLNCAGKKDYSRTIVDNPYADDMIAYEEFEADDNEGYPIMMHFSRAREFINQARRTGGKALVHCEMGVNRSGALCIAYMMVEERLTLLQALKRAKGERPVILLNEGFQKQLITFAKDQGLLNRDRSV